MSRGTAVAGSDSSLLTARGPCPEVQPEAGPDFCSIQCAELNGVRLYSNPPLVPPPLSGVHGDSGLGNRNARVSVLDGRIDNWDIEIYHQQSDGMILTTRLDAPMSLIHSLFFPADPRPDTGRHPPTCCPPKAAGLRHDGDPREV